MALNLEKKILESIEMDKKKDAAKMADEKKVEMVKDEVKTTSETNNDGTN